MANLAQIIGGAIGDAAGAANPATGIVDAASKIIGLFKLDPTVKAQLQAQLVQDNVDMEKAQLAAELAQVQGQLDANIEEAKSTNWWVAGARPGAMWVSVLGLFWAYVLQPFLIFVLTACHWNIGPLPVLNSDLLVTGLLMPLLGIGAYRTIEKIQGVQGNH